LGLDRIETESAMERSSRGGERRRGDAIVSKKIYPLTEIRRLLEPGPIVLVSSSWKDASNIMTMGWHMMLGFSPALFGCYIWEENHSY
jgi:flavin reductase (DIM6/NTAB) family NADH-FMN oxidoreductase RutF